MFLTHQFFFSLICAALAPLASNGELNLRVPNSLPLKIRIKQIQLEQVPLYLSNFVHRLDNGYRTPLNPPTTPALLLPI